MTGVARYAQKWGPFARVAVSVCLSFQETVDYFAIGRILMTDWGITRAHTESRAVYLRRPARTRSGRGSPPIL